MLSITRAPETRSAAACKRWEARPVKIKLAIAHDKMGGLNTEQGYAWILCQTALGYEASAGDKPQARSRPPKAFGTGMIRRNISYFGCSGHA